jgi:hypothetical protein
MAANHSVSTKMAAPSGGALNSNTKSIFWLSLGVLLYLTNLFWYCKLLTEIFF